MKKILIVISIFLMFNIIGEEINNKLIKDFIINEYFKELKIYVYEKGNKKVINIKDKITNKYICINTNDFSYILKKENLKKFIPEYYNYLLVNKNNYNKYNIKKEIIENKESFYIINNIECKKNIKQTNQYSSYTMITMKNKKIVVNLYREMSIPFIKIVYEKNGNKYKKIKELMFFDEEYNNY